MVFDQRTGQVDYDDGSITENTRVSSPGSHPEFSLRNHVAAEDGVRLAFTLVVATYLYYDYYVILCHPMLAFSSLAVQIELEQFR